MITSKSLVIAIASSATVAAAAAGGYLALRVDPSDARPATVTSPVSTATATESAKTAATRAATSPAPRKAATQAVPQPDRQTSAQAPSPSTTGSKPAAETPAATAPAQTATPPVSGAEEPPPVPDRAVDARDPPAPAEPPKPKFDELIVREDAVIGIRLDQIISTDTAKLEDKVTARVSRDVIVDGRTAIPSGARLEGTVTLIERGGRFKNVARLGIKFDTLVLTDNTRVTLRTEQIVRMGDPPTGEAASKIGASTVVGAILGGLIGGKKGAVIGGTAGAAGGTAAVMAGGPNEATIPAGTPLTVRLTAPVTILVERQER